MIKEITQFIMLRDISLGEQRGVCASPTHVDWLKIFIELSPEAEISPRPVSPFIFREIRVARCLKEANLSKFVPSGRYGGY